MLTIIDWLYFVVNSYVYQKASDNNSSKAFPEVPSGTLWVVKVQSIEM